LGQRHFNTPEIAAIEVITKEAERTEITDNVLAIGRRGGGGGRAELFEIRLELSRFYFAFPERRAISATQRDGLESVVIVEGSQKNLVVEDAERSLAARKRSFPGDILLGGEFRRRPLVAKDIVEM